MSVSVARKGSERWRRRRPRPKGHRVDSEVWIAVGRAALCWAVLPCLDAVVQYLQHRRGCGLGAH